MAVLQNMHETANNNTKASIMLQIVNDKPFQDNYFLISLLLSPLPILPNPPHKIKG